jgi:hypothetical protein
MAGIVPVTVLASKITRLFLVRTTDVATWPALLSNWVPATKAKTTTSLSAAISVRRSEPGRHVAESRVGTLLETARPFSADHFVAGQTSPRHPGKGFQAA